MANNRNGYTKGYTDTDPWPEGNSCDVRRKPEKKRGGQRGPRRQTEADTRGDNVSGRHAR